MKSHPLQRRRMHVSAAAMNATCSARALPTLDIIDDARIPDASLHRGDVRRVKAELNAMMYLSQARSDRCSRTGLQSEIESAGIVVSCLRACLDVLHVPAENRPYRPHSSICTYMLSEEQFQIARTLHSRWHHIPQAV